jgi:hypothetical protein
MRDVFRQFQRNLHGNAPSVHFSGRRYRRWRDGTARLSQGAVLSATLAVQNELCERGHISFPSAALDNSGQYQLWS